ncbi:MAG TPA: ANTAR domain-containing protein [Streptosporangiaceae bacterium]|nr:ANTAR domain-containing protein [Streptosporangiaceae bacterium]
MGGAALPGSDLADRAAALLSLAAATQERSLSQLTTLVAGQVPGCAAANVTVWRDGELASQASSHPDPARLVAVQVASNRGPLIDAIADGSPVSCPDTLTETRWPEFTAAALQVGVRSTMTLSGRGATVIVLTLLGLRPRAIEADQLPLAELLVAYGGALVGAVSDYDDSRRVATQLRDAADARATVDQAKGILMHALGCTADEALERMREVSQRSNLRATEVARRVIDAHSRPGGRDTRRELGQLADLANRKQNRAHR